MNDREIKAEVELDEAAKREQRMQLRAALSHAGTVARLLGSIPEVPNELFERACGVADEIEAQLLTSPGRVAAHHQRGDWRRAVLRKGGDDPSRPEDG